MPITAVGEVHLIPGVVKTGVSLVLIMEHHLVFNIHFFLNERLEFHITCSR